MQSPRPAHERWLITDVKQCNKTEDRDKHTGGRERLDGAEIEYETGYVSSARDGGLRAGWGRRSMRQRQRGEQIRWMCACWWMVLIGGIVYNARYVEVVRMRDACVRTCERQAWDGVKTVCDRRERWNKSDGSRHSRIETRKERGDEADKHSGRG
jgi:hypothetical protein